MDISCGLGDRRDEGWVYEKMGRAYRALENDTDAATATHMAEHIAQEVGSLTH